MTDTRLQLSPQFDCADQGRMTVGLQQEFSVSGRSPDGRVPPHISLWLAAGLDWKGGSVWELKPAASYRPACLERWQRSILSFVRRYHITHVAALHRKHRPLHRAFGVHSIQLFTFVRRRCAAKTQRRIPMTTSPDSPSSDLRGISRLAFDAVTGVIGIVETMHGNIARRCNPFASRSGEKTSRITRLVYRSIRGVTHLAGMGTDVALALLDPVLTAKPKHPSPTREAARAALNGVLGDHLVETDNSLAIPMRLRLDGLPLQLERASLAAALFPARNRLAVMVHGLCLNDRQWSRDDHDHGAALAHKLGYAVVYLHYNTGLHISINGRAFADLLEALVTQWPVRLEELAIIGHSMGGLVARSACHYGAVGGHAWPGHLHKLIFLGTPHHGAPMERGGQWLHLALGRSPYTAAFTHLGRIRSAGITDLRYGNLLDGDWQDRDRFEHVGDTRQIVPLPAGVQCFAIAATTGREAGGLRDRLLGDGLVPLASALGQHEDPRRTLSIPEDRQWIGRTMNHFDLLSRQDVYDRMSLWLGPGDRYGEDHEFPRPDS